MKLGMCLDSDAAGAAGLGEKVLNAMNPAKGRDGNPGVIIAAIPIIKLDQVIGVANVTNLLAWPGNSEGGRKRGRLIAPRRAVDIPLRNEDLFIVSQSNLVAEEDFAAADSGQIVRGDFEENFGIWLFTHRMNHRLEREDVQLRLRGHYRSPT